MTISLLETIEESPRRKPVDPQANLKRHLHALFRIQDRLQPDGSDEAFKEAVDTLCNEIARELDYLSKLSKHKRGPDKIRIKPALGSNAVSATFNVTAHVNSDSTQRAFEQVVRNLANQASSQCLTKALEAWKIAISSQDFQNRIKVMSQAEQITERKALFYELVDKYVDEYRLSRLHNSDVIAND